MYEGQDIVLTEEMGRRLIDLIGKRLAIPVMPLPGESLVDLIFRACCMNGYNIFRPRIVNHRYQMNRFDLATLSNRLGTAHGAMDLVAIHYPQVGNGDEKSLGAVVSFFGSRLGRRLLIPHRRVAASSLERSLHSKAMWHVRPLGFDARTHEKLLSNCWECGELLNFRPGLGVNRCQVCGPTIDLRDGPKEIEAFDDVEAIRAFTDLIDPEGGRRSHGLLHSDLSSEDPGDVFTLGVVLAEIIATPDIGTPTSSTVAPLPPKSLEKAARALMSWPNGVLEILEQTEGVSFGPIRPKNGQHSHGRLVTRTRYKVSRSLHDTIQEVERLYRMRPVAVARGSAARQSSVAGRDPLAVLRAAGKYTEAATRTGLPPLVFYRCYLSGHFGDLTDSSTVTGVEFENWLRRLEIGYLRPSKSPGLMKVTNFVKAAFRDGGDPWPAIIDAILRRKLPVVCPADASTFVQLEVPDPLPWKEFVAGVFARDDISQQVRREDACFYLNVSNSGLRGGPNTPMTFDGLKSFDRRYVKALEISDRLTLRGETLSAEKVSSRLTAAGIVKVADYTRGTWRSRAEAEALFNL